MSEPRRWTLHADNTWEPANASAHESYVEEGTQAVEAAPVEAELERLRGLLTEAVHYLDSCGCDDEDCPGRQKAAQIREALGEPPDAE